MGLNSGVLLSQLLWLCAHLLCNRPLSACCATIS
eukprot:UN11145